jgi:glycosyltransferase involved in cell wall biosynthesis
MSGSEGVRTEVPREHLLSVVIPVYLGEKHLPALLAEIEPLVATGVTPAGHRFRVIEAVLVHDCGPDDSATVMRELAARFPWVRPIWLSRNFGQHAATIAGMASSGGEWIVTMDEDGQHDPADITGLLDVAMSSQARLVYGAPVTKAPHNILRRATSWSAKRVLNLVSGGVDASRFHSFRLVLGEAGRSVSAFAGPGMYLDVALSWVIGTPATAPVTLRDEGERKSGYRLRTLLSHFWRMVLTNGTRPLRIVSLVGAVFGVLGVLLAGYVVVGKLLGTIDVQGWASLVAVSLLGSGLILFSLGIVAEYVGVAVNTAMGRPLYVVTGDAAEGPLGRDPGRG